MSVVEEPTPCAEVPTVDIPTLEGKLRYHAFIAHSTDDNDVAYTLTEDLEEKCFKCFMYERDLPPDSTIVTGVVKNIHRSRRVILVITESFLKSRWGMFEAMEALSKGYIEDQMVLVPILYKITIDKIPHYLRPYRCLDYDDEHFWRLLTLALVEDRPATDLIPAGNVAHGLAWSYYYGFLKLVLPGITDRSEEWLAQQNKMGFFSWIWDALWTFPHWGKTPPVMLKKMMIIIPSTCYCPASFVNLNLEAFSHIGHIPYSATRAGNIKRDYKSSVYKVKDPDSDEEFLFIGEFVTPVLSMYEMLHDREFLFIGEFATPVLSIYDMVHDGLAGLKEEDKLHQGMLFTDKLKDILSHPVNKACHNRFTVLEYDDETEDKAKELPRVICQHIRHELKREKELLAHMEELRIVPISP